MASSRALSALLLVVGVIMAGMAVARGGGALALGVGDRVLALSNAVYSVISPEGCAAILWKNASEASKAARALRLTARDLLELGIIDQIVPEPPQGAHTSHEEAARLLDESLLESLTRAMKLSSEERLARRYEKVRALGF